MSKRDDWQPSRRAELAYERELRGIMERLLSDAISSVSSPLDLADMLNALVREDWFQHAALESASRMVTGLAVENARTWREAARLSMRGPEIYSALQSEMHGPVGARVRELVAENAQLIRSMPGQLAERITGFVAREQQKGIRASEIAKQLRVQLPDVSAGRIRLISRTEVSKASTALIESRAESLDLNWYVWRSSEDSRVRPSHRLMDARGGCLVRWNDPASPEALLGIRSALGHYHAGNCPNCRCYPEPLLRLNQIRFPHPVYYGGRIQMMTMAAFAKIAGAEVRMAAA